MIHPWNGAILPPPNGGIQNQINRPKHGGGITVRISNSQQVSTNVIPTQTQMSGFIRNKKIDLRQAYNEFMRRAEELGCKDFDYSIEDFQSLARENVEIIASSVREAITILEGQMHGYYKNPKRENYGIGVNGPYFIVEGVGEFKHITHVEVKNPIGSAIREANDLSGSIARQGKKIGVKINYQQNLWSNPSRLSRIPGITINPNANLPASPSNVLGLVDNFDVPVHEKAAMEASALRGYNATENIIFLNNVTNV